MRARNPWIDITPYQNAVRSLDDRQNVNSDEFKIAVVMLYGSVNRVFSASRLAWETNTLLRLCRPAVRNLKQSKIWKQKGRISKHEFNSKKNSKDDLQLTISFWADALVASGKVCKIKGAYGLSEWTTKYSYGNKVRLKLKLAYTQNRIKQLQRIK